jgi:hypothetical protein
VGTQSNKQRETQLLVEWLATLPAFYKWKTHVRVGAVQLVYQGQPLSPAQQRAFGVWNDWMDARVASLSEVWCVEAKIVGVAAAYGQAMDYTHQYAASADARNFPSHIAVPVVVCAFEKPQTAAYFNRFGVRTIVFTPSWAGSSLVNKVFPASDASTPV